MECKVIRKEIDRYWEAPDHSPGDAVMLHIRSCGDCALYFESTGKARRAVSILKQSEPLLNDPAGLAEGIMAGLNSDQPAFTTLHAGNKRNTRVLELAQRILAAASVCLLLVFSFEQYVVMNKISDLEKQNAVICRSDPYNYTLKIKQALKIIEGDPAMLAEYRDLQKTGILNAHYLLKNIQDQFSYPKNNTGK